MMRASTFRTGILFIFFQLLYVLILINLYFIQIGNHHFFQNLAERQYASLATIYPPRAFIVDRNGNPLAMNQESVAAFIIPSLLKEQEALTAFLKRSFYHAYERLEKNISAHFMYIARNLDKKTEELLSQSGLEDIHFLKEPSRFYPLACAGTIIGFTNIDNQGIAGLELAFNETLSGAPQVKHLLKDARSGLFHFDHEIKSPGETGHPLALSLDATLQFLVYEAVKQTVEKYEAAEGCAIVMNPKNGEILAMVSYPDFDPNNLHHIDQSLTKNRVCTQVQEFGSIMKAFAALAAIEEGVVRADELVDCENKATTFVDGRPINTVPSSVAGVIPFTQVIEKSNNIGIAKIVKRLGIRLYDHYIRLGFGAKTGIEFPGELEGFVNPPEQWSKQSIISLSYGYEINATVLQIAQAISLIANGGYFVKPTLLYQADTACVPTKEYRYTKESCNIMQTIMENTVLHGTAKKAHIKGYRVMSKTGTANLLVNGTYDKTKNCYSCGGIVEKGLYSRVIVVFVKQAYQKGLYASTVAAPLFEQIAERTLIHEKIC